MFGTPRRDVRAEGVSLSAISAANDDTQTLVGEHHSKVAVEVGAPHVGAVSVEPGQQCAVRLPVWVVSADGDQCDDRIHRVEELDLLKRGSVVAQF